MRAAVVYVRVVAIVFLIFGVIALVVPDGYLALFGADASVGGRLWGRAFATAGPEASPSASVPERGRSGE